MRRTGKTHLMVLGIKNTIEAGGLAAVAGCTDPADILSRLASMGVEAKAEIMERTEPLQALFEGLEDFVGFNGGEKVQTGYIFSKKN